MRERLIFQTETGREDYRFGDLAGEQGQPGGDVETRKSLVQGFPGRFCKRNRRYDAIDVIPVAIQPISHRVQPRDPWPGRGTYSRERDIRPFSAG